MRKLTLLDLFCGAGGAAMGYYSTGFKVVGVDIKPQPHYPFQFIEADALDFVTLYGQSFDMIHASPPCQRYTKQAKQKRTSESHPDLIGPVRDVVVALNKPYVIENVLEARSHLKDPVMLCGTQFGLGVFRHRLFESSTTIPELAHRRHYGRIGDGTYVSVTGHTGGRSLRDGILHGVFADWQRAMNIDWMSADEMTQAIPPVYTEYVGNALRDEFR
jgi:DNA (cytosine-5)-methyltransferase 1